MKCWYN